MEAKHFKTEYLSYGTRLRKEFLAGFLIVSAILLYAYFKDGLDDFALTIQMILVFGAAYALYQIYLTREYITEVRIIEDTMTIIGYNFNSRWEKQFEIKDLSIEIRSNTQYRGRVEYFLRVRAQGRHFDVNRSLNWDYFSLRDIYHEYKRVKGERIIFDEKYFLDIMEKKAHGLSTIEIGLGKEIKK